MPLVLAVTLPWFIWADAATHGEFFRVFILRHNLERGLGDGDLTVAPLVVLSAAVRRRLPAVESAAARRRPSSAGAAATGAPTPKSASAWRWFAAVTLVLSCAGFKRGDYLLPAYPGAALFLGAVFANEERRWREARPRAVWSALCLLPCLLAVGMTVGWLVQVEWVLPAEEPYHDYARFAAEVRRRAPPPEEVRVLPHGGPRRWRFT